METRISIESQKLPPYLRELEASRWTIVHQRSLRKSLGKQVTGHPLWSMVEQDRASANDSVLVTVCSLCHTNTTEEFSGIDVIEGAPGDVVMILLLQARQKFHLDKTLGVRTLDHGPWKGWWSRDTLLSICIEGSRTVSLLEPGNRSTYMLLATEIERAIPRAEYFKSFYCLLVRSVSIEIESRLADTRTRRHGHPNPEVQEGTVSG